MPAPINMGAGVIVASGTLTLPAGAGQTAHVVKCVRANADCAVILTANGATGRLLTGVGATAAAGQFTLNHTSGDPGATGTFNYIVVDAAENA